MIKRRTLKHGHHTEEFGREQEERGKGEIGEQSLGNPTMHAVYHSKQGV